MPGIEIKGRSKIANYRHGGRTKKFGGGSTNLLEELGRVEGERSNPNRRAEISRVHGELNRGYAKGGRAGFKHGTKPDWKKGKFGKKTIAAMKKHDFPAGGPHQSLEGKKAALQHATIRAGEPKKKKVDWEKGKFSKATLAAMKKHDFPGGGPHQTVEGKKAALQKLTQHLKKKKD